MCTGWVDWGRDEREIGLTRMRCTVTPQNEGRTPVFVLLLCKAAPAEAVSRLIDAKCNVDKATVSEAQRD
eukprot:3901690-Rhodomonas_salina.1